MITGIDIPVWMKIIKVVRDNVNENNEPLTLTEISSRIDTTYSHVLKIVDILEKLKIIGTSKNGRTRIIVSVNDISDSVVDVVREIDYLESKIRNKNKI